MKDFLNDEVKNKRSQDLPIYYRLNGAIYTSDINYFYELSGFIGDKAEAYIMEQKNSVDIETELNLKIAETILNRK